MAYYLSRFYRKDELGFRLAIYIVCAPLAGAFGGLLASGILKLEGFGMVRSWRLIFFIVRRSLFYSSSRLRERTELVLFLCLALAFCRRVSSRWESRLFRGSHFRIAPRRQSGSITTRRVGQFSLNRRTTKGGTETSTPADFCPLPSLACSSHIALCAARIKSENVGSTVVLEKMHTKYTRDAPWRTSSDLTSSVFARS
jgi:MFS family permease